MTRRAGPCSRGSARPPATGWPRLYMTCVRPRLGSRRVARSRLSPLSDPGLPVPDAFRPRRGWRCTRPRRSRRCATSSGGRRHSMSRSGCISSIAGAGASPKPRCAPSPRRGDRRLYPLRARSRPRRRPARPRSGAGALRDRVCRDRGASGWQIPATRLRGQPLPRVARNVCRIRIPDPGPRGGSGARRAVCPARRRGPLSRARPRLSRPPPGSRPISGRWACAAESRR